MEVFTSDPRRRAELAIDSVSAVQEVERRTRPQPRRENSYGQEGCRRLHKNVDEPIVEPGFGGDLVVGDRRGRRPAVDLPEPLDHDGVDFAELMVRKKQMPPFTLSFGRPWRSRLRRAGLTCVAPTASVSQAGLGQPARFAAMRCRPPGWADQPAKKPRTTAALAWDATAHQVQKKAAVAGDRSRTRPALFNSRRLISRLSTESWPGTSVSTRFAAQSGQRRRRPAIRRRFHPHRKCVLALQGSPCNARSHGWTTNTPRCSRCWPLLGNAEHGQLARPREIVSAHRDARRRRR